MQSSLNGSDDKARPQAATIDLTHGEPDSRRNFQAQVGMELLFKYL